ncbi:polysaccharide biosynthesis protein [Brachybacterium huguangmaarense]
MAEDGHPAPVRAAGGTFLGLRRDSVLLYLLVLAVADIALSAVAWAVVAVVPPPQGSLPALLALWGAAAVGQLVVGLAAGIYQRRMLIGSPPEIRGQALAVAGGTVLAAAVDLLAGLGVGALAVLAAGLLTLALVVAYRHVFRILLDGQRRPDAATPVVIAGAGNVGMSVVDQMLRTIDGDYLPVAFVDDSPAKRRFRYRGVKVLGSVADTAEVLAETGAEGVVIAVGRPAPAMYATLAEQVAESGAWVRTVPSAGELVGSVIGSGAAWLREIDVTDLIGRAPAPPDLEGARELVHGRRVLVTGAGGSIGSELCRQLHALDPGELVMLDRDESALHDLQMSLTRRALLDTPDLALADIRDPEALDAVFALHKPEIVFHAAALKHLPLLQSHPLEAWKSNVHGTQNVIEAAARHGAATFVNISTDKAARPTSALGTSKRIAEGLTSSAAARSGDRFMSVRFGNVIGSRGSAVPAFAEQIRQGGPVTITHPEVSRYFMTIPEACALVLVAAAAGRPGETLILDLGESVRIRDLASRLMALMGRPCSIVYTGLRDGEKLHEELLTPLESEVIDRRDGIFHVHNGGIDPLTLPHPEASLAEVDGYTARVLTEDHSDQQVGL